VAFAESPVAALVEGDVKHRANLLTKKSAKLKIQNTIIVPDEDRFVQNATGIAHRHTLANSQIFPLHRVDNCYKPNCTLDASSCGLRDTCRPKRLRRLVVA
jgi:hypothetical protein